MKLLKLTVITLLICFSVSAAAAGDFAWVKDFNIQAQADPAGFRAKLAAKFNLGDLQVKAILSNCGRPSDAYIVLRLGEMSGIDPGLVHKKYRQNKGKGWGSLAKSLGIKPGSEEFHALKNGQDLYDNSGHRRAHQGKQRGQDVNLVVNLQNNGKKKRIK